MSLSILWLLVPIYKIGVVWTACLTWLDCPDDIKRIDKVMKSVARGLIWPVLAYKHLRNKPKE